MKEVSYRKGGACAAMCEFITPEPGEPWVTVEPTPEEQRSMYVIEIKNYITNEWVVRARAKSASLARIMYRSLLKLKGYGDEVRIRRVPVDES